MSDQLKPELRLVNFPEEALLTKINESANKPQVVVVEKIDITDKGIFTHIQGFKYPLKGYPYYPIINDLNIIKKVIIEFLQFLYKTKIGLLLLLIPAIRWLAIERLVVLSERILSHWYLKPTAFCKSAQELYRVGMLYRDKAPEKKKWIYWRLTMLICMLWEYDTAYRFRGQYLLSQSKNPKEIYKIILKRETDKAILEKAKAVKWMLGFIKPYLQPINQDEIKLDEADMWFAKFKVAFKWDE